MVLCAPLRFAEGVADILEHKTIWPSCYRRDVACLREVRAVTEQAHRCLDAD
jgi:hypothetical protein